MLTFAVVPRAEAQYPRPRVGQFEIPGKDFRSNGAWRQRTNAIRAQRQAMLAAGRFGAMNVRGSGASSAVVTGSFKIPVVPIRYSKYRHHHAVHAGRVPGRCSSPARRRPALTASRPTTSSCRTGTSPLTGWSSRGCRWTPPTAYYEDGCNGAFCADPSRFGSDAHRQALATGVQRRRLVHRVGAVRQRRPRWHPELAGRRRLRGLRHFPAAGSRRRRAGPRTSGPTAGSSAASTTAPATSPRRSAPVADASRFPTTSSRAVGRQWGLHPGQIMPIGTVAHETGHAFGLPDLYDTPRTPRASASSASWAPATTPEPTAPRAWRGGPCWSSAGSRWIPSRPPAPSR